MSIVLYAMGRESAPRCTVGGSGRRGAGGEFETGGEWMEWMRARRAGGGGDPNQRTRGGGRGGGRG